MKKVIAIFSILAIMIASLTFIVSATEIRVDFNKAYVMDKNPMTLRYNPENLFFFARARTDLSVASDHVGHAEVTIKTNIGVSKSKREVNKDGNMISTGVVEVDGAAYATEVHHIGFRHSNATGQFANFIYDVKQI